MGTHYKNQYRTKNVPQQEPTPGRDEVQNSAGGFVFAVTDEVRLERFLILGTEGGTYYVGEANMTKDAGEVVRRLVLAGRGRTVVDKIVEISDTGRAASNDPALFALAICAGLGDKDTRKYALQNLPKVARIGTHLFHFASYVENFRGWGRLLKEAVANWYLDKDNNDLAYDVMKYRQRDGWSHRDLLRLSHPQTEDPVKKAIFNAVCKQYDPAAFVLPAEQMDDSAKKFASAIHVIRDEAGVDIPQAIKEFNLPREVIPTDRLKDMAIMQELFERMPMGALLRNLNRLTAMGILKPMNANTKRVVEKLTNQEAIIKSRLHPFNIMLANYVYRQGMGYRGGMQWDPIPAIIDALDSAFKLAFPNVKSTGKNLMLAFDVSGSMHWGFIKNSPITCAQASAAMGIVTVHSEVNYHTMAFADEFIKFPITKRSSIDSVVRAAANINFGATDCSLPMLYAQKNKLEIDGFVVYTDNETWAGRIKPVDALNNYRQAMGRDAKLVVVGMTATQFSIADPNDAGMLDVVGFDSATPQMLSEFIRG